MEILDPPSPGAKHDAVGPAAGAGASEDLRAIIEAIYSRDEHHILPFVGDAYTEPHPDELRVMTVGINAYVDESDWPPSPTWHREWIATRRHAFQKAVIRAATTLGNALTTAPAIFAGKRFDAMRSVYATNAVKVYVPEARGKRAVLLDDADWLRHRAQWHDELAVLAEAGVFPHVVVIFSKRFWEPACQTFHPTHDGSRLGVTDARDFVSLGEDTEHRANRIVLRVAGGEQPVLLVRLRHPAGRGREGTAAWLLQRAAFRRFVGLL